MFSGGVFDPLVPEPGVDAGDGRQRMVPDGGIGGQQVPHPQPGWCRSCMVVPSVGVRPCGRTAPWLAAACPRRYPRRPGRSPRSAVADGKILTVVLLAVLANNGKLRREVLTNVRRASHQQFYTQNIGIDSGKGIACAQLVRKAIHRHRRAENDECHCLQFHPN